MPFLELFQRTRDCWFVRVRALRRIASVIGFNLEVDASALQSARVLFICRRKKIGPLPRDLESVLDRLQEAPDGAALRPEIDLPDRNVGAAHQYTDIG